MYMCVLVCLYERKKEEYKKNKEKEILKKKQNTPRNRREHTQFLFTVVYNSKFSD